MSEPMWLGGDAFSYSKNTYAIQEVECCVCDKAQEVEVEETHAHGETTWYVEWDCEYCGTTQEKEGWY